MGSAFSKVTRIAVSILMGMSLSNGANAIMWVLETGVNHPVRYCCEMRSITKSKHPRNPRSRYKTFATMRFNSPDVCTLEFFKHGWRSETLNLSDIAEQVPSDIDVIFHRRFRNQKILHLSNFEIIGQRGRIEYFKFLGTINDITYTFEFSYANRKAELTNSSGIRKTFDLDIGAYYLGQVFALGVSMISASIL